jgi:hypothetical protein
MLVAPNGQSHRIEIDRCCIALRDGTDMWTWPENASNDPMPAPAKKRVRRSFPSRQTPP